MTLALPYKRVLLKCSGESLAGKNAFGFDFSAVNRFVQTIDCICNLGIEVALVIGGGNIFRGRVGQKAGMKRAVADQVGMLATIKNSLFIQEALESLGRQTRMMSAVRMDTICEPYIPRRATAHLSKNRLVILSGGLGIPFFTTDTAAAIRANELDCEVLIKGTGVDGIYSCDPKKDPKAIRYPSLSYQEMLNQNLKVMDASAVTLARDNDLPILVCKMQELLKVVQLKGSFTLVGNNAKNE